MAGALGRSEPDVFSSAVLHCPSLVPAAPLRHPIELVEAARQLVMMLGHVVYGHSLDSHVVWIDLRADIPVAPPSDLPLELRWRSGTIGRVRPRATFDLELVTGATVLGSLRFVTHTMSPTAYRKLRNAA